MAVSPLSLGDRTLVDGHESIRGRVVGRRDDEDVPRVAVVVPDERRPVGVVDETIERHDAPERLEAAPADGGRRVEHRLADVVRERLEHRRVLDELHHGETRPALKQPRHRVLLAPRHELLVLKVVHGRFDRAPFGLCELSRARARCREAERDAEHGGENLRESKADTEPLSCE